MPDMDSRRTDRAVGITVGDALRALPMESPARSEWSRLAAGLQRRPPQRRHRWPVALAAAAVLVAALALPRLLTSPIPVEQAASDVAVVDDADAPAAKPPIDALIAESAMLESMLAAAQDGSVASGDTAAVRTVLGDRLQVVDLLLSDPATDAATRHSLWQERVVLLRRLAGLERSELMLAAGGDAGQADLMLTL